MAKVNTEITEKKKVILSELEKSLEIKPKETTPAVKETPAEIKPIENVTETTPDVPKTETDTKTPETTETTPEVKPLDNIKRPPSSSLFETFKQKTEEDGKSNESRLDHIAETITDKDLLDDDLNLDAESPAVQKEMADVKATAWVELGELGMSLLCMWISGDWSQDAQNKKFIISAPKKKAVKIAIMRIILAKKKKTNPTWAVVGLSLGACVPMLIVAFIGYRQKKQLAISHKENTDALIALERLKAQNAKPLQDGNMNNFTNVPVTETTEIDKKINTIYEQRAAIANSKMPLTVASEKRGRHKKDCSYYKNKPCNCKK